MIYKEFLTAWLHEQKTFQKYSTYTNYLNIVENHLIPDLGDSEMYEVNGDVIQDYILEKLRSGNRLTGGPISISFAKSILTVIRMTAGNTGNVKLPYYCPKQIETFSQQEVLTLINALQSKLTCKGIGVLLAIHTGMRIGEICALQWKDVDLKSRTIRVTKTIIRTYNKSEGSRVSITPPKTRTSTRTIPLNSWICQLLYLVCGDSESFIVSGKPKPTEPGKLRSWYNRVLKQNKIEHRKFHCLRHTFATTCISCGCDYKSLSQILGHSNVSVTMNLYVHPDMEMKRRCVENLVDFYNANV